MTSNRWGWHDLPLGPFPGTGPEDHPGHPADGTWLESPLNSLMTMDLLKNGPHTHNWSTGSWNVWATTIALEPMGLDWALGMLGPFVFLWFFGPLFVHQNHTCGYSRGQPFRAYSMPAAAMMTMFIAPRIEYQGVSPIHTSEDIKKYVSIDFWFFMLN